MSSLDNLMNFCLKCLELLFEFIEYLNNKNVSKKNLFYYYFFIYKLIKLSVGKYYF